MSDMITAEGLAVLAARPGLPDDIRDALSDAAAQLADAKAAQAMVVERADIDAALDAMEANMRADGQTPLYWRENLPPEDQDKLRACVRAGIAAALADKNGLDLAQALRAERDALAERLENEMADLDAADRRNTRLAAANAALEAQVARLVGALEEARDAAHSVAHSEFDGVWSEQDFREFTPLADAALAAVQADARREGGE